MIRSVHVAFATLGPTLFLAVHPLPAQETEPGPASPVTVVEVEGLRWQPDPEFPELDHATVHGNLRTASPYVYRLRANAPAELPLHTHSRSEYVTVLRGTLHHVPEGGDRADARTCGAGCFVVLPSGRSHRAWLETGTVLQIHGIGPVEAHFPSAPPGRG